MDYFPLNWGQQRPSGANEHNWLMAPGTTASMPDEASVASARLATKQAAAMSHTQSPIVTGSSVVAFKYRDGIIMATDCLASYGSLARFRNVQRMHPVGTNTIVGASGDISDFQYIQRLLDEMMTSEHELQDEHVPCPSSIYQYLQRLLYSRRCDMNFLWNTLVVGGMQPNGTSFLGCVDMRGVTYSSSTLATGFGAHIAQPLLREEVEGREHLVSEEDAVRIMEKMMRVLFYRDARSSNVFQISVVDANGVRVSPAREISTEWRFAEGLRGYGRAMAAVPMAGNMARPQ